MHQLVLPRAFTRSLLAVACAVVSVTAGLVVVAPAAPAASDLTVCYDAALPRQATEIDTDLTVPQFDPALGTLLEVRVPTQTAHLDTDAVFENTGPATVMGEQMTYDVTFTSPGGLPAGPPISGLIVRVPSQTVAAFDGTLDFTGTSAVTQSPTDRDVTGTPVQTTTTAALLAFSGTSGMAFHVKTLVDDHFTSGGGNVAGLIHTFVSAAVTVCYRYAPAQVPEPTTVTTAGGTETPVVEARFTG